jgi:hypothetical protein
VTDCDNCILAPSDFISWSLTFTGTLNASFSGSTADVSGNAVYPLSASNGSITFSPAASGWETFSQGPDGVEFLVPFPGQVGEIYIATDSFNPTYTSPIYAPLIIANEVTPLPTALPLFATGLGAMGLIGWRRKRGLAGGGQK